MRLRSDTWIDGAGAPLGCEVRQLQLEEGQYRALRGVRLWAAGCRRANLVLAFPTGLAVDEPWYLVSNLEPRFDLVWTYSDRFCCEQLFRDQKSGIFQLENSGLQDPERLHRLLLVLAIAVLAGRSPLAAGHELSAARPELAAAVHEQRLLPPAGLEAHPAAAA